MRRELPALQAEKYAVVSVPWVNENPLSSSVSAVEQRNRREGGKAVGVRIAGPRDGFCCRLGVVAP